MFLDICRGGALSPPEPSALPFPSVGAGVSARPSRAHPVHLRRGEALSPPDWGIILRLQDRESFSLLIERKSCFALASARNVPPAGVFLHQRRKTPKTPFRNYVSKNFLSAWRGCACRYSVPHDHGRKKRFSCKYDTPCPSFAAALSINDRSASSYRLEQSGSVSGSEAKKQRRYYI